jgi:Holliday junction resolvasome RuvABC DNA-binding subunit
MLHRPSSKQCTVQGMTALGDLGYAPTGQDAAQKAIDQVPCVSLSMADQEVFASALIAPPKPNAALKRGFKRRKQLLSNA